MAKNLCIGLAACWNRDCSLNGDCRFCFESRVFSEWEFSICFGTGIVFWRLTCLCRGDGRGVHIHTQTRDRRLAQCSALSRLNAGKRLLLMQNTELEAELERMQALTEELRDACKEKVKKVEARHAGEVEKLRRQRVEMEGQVMHPAALAVSCLPPDLAIHPVSCTTAAVRSRPRSELIQRTDPKN